MLVSKMCGENLSAELFVHTKKSVDFQHWCDFFFFFFSRNGTWENFLFAAAQDVMLTYIEIWGFLHNYSIAAVW